MRIKRLKADFVIVNDVNTVSQFSFKGVDLGKGE